MNIIFGDDAAKELKNKYTVLELDTVRIQLDGRKFTAYAVVESIAIDDLPLVEGWTNLHQSLMTNYRKRDWNFCEQAIEQLSGKWGNELDTFYLELQSRINNYKDIDPGMDWDPTIQK